MTLFKFTDINGDKLLICADKVEKALKYVEGFDWVKIEKIYEDITIAR